MPRDAVVLDSIHARAVCDEIGARLRDVLGPELAEMPPHLRRLVDRLAEFERAPSIVPSIVPSIAPGIDDMRAGMADNAEERAAASGHHRNSA